MLSALVPSGSVKSIPLVLLTEMNLRTWLKHQPSRIGEWVRTNSFEAKPGTYCILPDNAGKPENIVVGVSEPPSLWDLGGLPSRLPAGLYHISWDGPASLHEWLALGWELGAYQFARYKKAGKFLARLAVSRASDFAKIKRYAEAINLARDLINTPAEDLGPAELAQAIASAGKKFGARVKQISGEKLRRKNFSAIHMVGRASSRAPRLVDLVWGNPKHPKVTLVGKGVCFDTGGLDLKPSGGMYLMKKDMGGAASALAVAWMIMDARLPVRLRLLVPAVENAVSGNAFRPTDVIRMRNGLTVEVGNTDAEGRLVLADALSETVGENPEIVIDFSTLTGAARTAVGTEISAVFCNDDKLAEELSAHGRQMEDPMWRLPLHAGYNKMLDSSVADLNSCPSSPYAGAITAALFLQRFVSPKQIWAHIDFMSWNLSARPGRPEGGEAMAARAVFRTIENRYPKVKSGK
ncbi:MAG: M17 family metallopeptidase [Bdellovibrionales bacterium]